MAEGARRACNLHRTFQSRDAGAGGNQGIAVVRSSVCQLFANTDLLHKRGVIAEQIFLGHDALFVPMPQGRHRKMAEVPTTYGKARPNSVSPAARLNPR